MTPKVKPEDLIPVVQVQGRECHILLGSSSVVLTNPSKIKNLINSLTKAYKEIEHADHILANSTFTPQRGS